MDLKDRLQLIISKNNLNASSFADKLKIQRSNMSHILSGRNKPSLDFIEKFILHFPEEDVLWLITGLKRDNDHESIQTLKFKQQDITENKPLFIKNDKINKRPELNKKIFKIVTFYDNNTFDVYYPNS
jgi:transcriptional regulator with XRE-family HTH domain